MHPRPPDLTPLPVLASKVDHDLTMSGTLCAYCVPSTLWRFLTESSTLEVRVCGYYPKAQIS